MRSARSTLRTNAGKPSQRASLRQPYDHTRYWSFFHAADLHAEHEEALCSSKASDGVSAAVGNSTLAAAANALRGCARSADLSLALSAILGVDHRRTRQAIIIQGGGDE